MLENQHILLAGYGQLARTLAPHICAQNQVYALQRSLPAGEADGVHLLQGDLLAPATLTQLPDHVDYVVIALTPDARNEAGYRAVFIDAVANLLAALTAPHAVKRVLFVSSTSVYHQNDGSLVDEHSPTLPTGYAGRTLVEAENALLASGLPTSIVRCSGIYGGERTYLLQRVVQGELRPSLKAKLSNRIHQDDAAAVLQHLLQQDAAGQTLAPVYLASDDAPCSLNEVIAFIRERCGLPVLAPSADAAVSQRGGDKRCNNRRLKESGFVFRYPSFREGYGEQLVRHRDEVAHWLTADDKD